MQRVQRRPCRRKHVGTASAGASDGGKHLSEDGILVEAAEFAREPEGLQLLTAGRRNRSTAAALNISEDTVKFHVRNVFKQGMASRTEAIALAHGYGLRQDRQRCRRQGG